MLTERRHEVSDGVALNGHRARRASVTSSTLPSRSGVEEALKGPAGRLAVALVGLALFGWSFVAFRLSDSPPRGGWGMALEIAGWLGMLAAASLVTRRWVAPSLVVTAFLLLMVGNSFGTRLIQRGTDRGLELGFNYVTALITLEAGTWLLVAVLMVDGAVKLWEEDTHRA